MRYDIKTKENSQSLTFESYLKMGTGKYRRAKYLVQTFYPQGHLDLSDLHSEFNAVAWEAYYTNMPVREFLNLLDRRFYYLLTRLYGLRRVRNEQGRYVWKACSVEIETYTNKKGGISCVSCSVSQ